MGGTASQPAAWFSGLSQEIQNLGEGVKNGLQDKLNIDGGDSIVDMAIGSLQVIENASKGVVGVVLPGDILMAGDLNFWKDRVNDLNGIVDDLKSEFNDLQTKINKATQYVSAFKTYKAPFGDESGCALNFPTFEQFLAGTELPNAPALTQVDTGTGVPPEGFSLSKKGSIVSGTEYALKGGREGGYCKTKDNGIINCNKSRWLIETKWGAEKFIALKIGEIPRWGEPLYVIKSAKTGKYCAIEEGTNRLLCNKDSYRFSTGRRMEGTTFITKPRENGTTAIRPAGPYNNYCADEATGVVCNRPNIYQWEEFKFIIP